MDHDEQNNTLYQHLPKKAGHVIRMNNNWTRRKTLDGPMEGPRPKEDQGRRV